MDIKQLASRRNLGRAAALAAVLTVMGTTGSLASTGMTADGEVYAEQTDVLEASAPAQAIVPAAEGSTEDEIKYVQRTDKKPVAFDTIYREDVTIPDGEQTVLVEGIEGETTVNILVTMKNGKESHSRVLSETVTKLPVNKVVLVGVAKKGNSGANAETTAPQGESGTAETTKWKPLPLWQTKPDGTDVKVIKASEKKSQPVQTMQPSEPAQTEYITEITESTAPVEQIAARTDAPAQISRFEVPSWVQFDENGVPRGYTAAYTGRACAYTANPGALMSTGKSVFQGYVAVDPRLIPYGSELYIVADDGDVYGYAIAGDTGYSVRAGDIVVDLFMDEYNDCIRWGNKNVTVYILKDGSAE